MKRVFFLLFLGAFIFASCEKDPDFSNLDEEFVVVTKYDDTYNFKNNAKTFYISDTITLLSSDAKNPKWCDANSAQIIAAIRTNLESLGYTYVAYNPSWTISKFTPQYLIGVTAVKDMNTVIYTNNYWWDYYPYYWWWGGYYPYYPYYPWVTGYTYDTGTTLIDMIDMQVAPYAPQSSTTPKSGTGGHPVRWNAIIGGLLNTGNDMLFEKDAINDAFTQSPYLNVK